MKLWVWGWCSDGQDKKFEIIWVLVHFLFFCLYLILPVAILPAQLKTMNIAERKDRTASPSWWQAKKVRELVFIFASKSCKQECIYYVSLRREKGAISDSWVALYIVTCMLENVVYIRTCRMMEYKASYINRVETYSK